jgi:hypothetical protein
MRIAASAGRLVPRHAHGLADVATASGDVGGQAELVAVIGGRVAREDASAHVAGPMVGQDR